MSNVRIFYLKNDISGQIGQFVSYQPGWSPASAEDLPVPVDEVVAYLLEKAKTAKILELKDFCDDFCLAGYEYDGRIVCDAWESSLPYTRNDLVLGSDYKNYKNLKDNTDHDPISDPEFWEEFCPVFRTNNKTIQNILLKEKLSSELPHRYTFRDKNKIPIDFEDETIWSLFTAALFAEKDRILIKYNEYYEQIDLCETEAEVVAIVIDFTA